MRKHLIVLLVGSLGAALLATPASAEGDPPAGRFPQTIALTRLSDTTVDQRVPVHASASSLLPVTLTASGACTLEQVPGGDFLVATGPGECGVTASQDGDEFWLPAPLAQESFRFVGGEAGVRVSIDGPQWLLTAQGLPLDVSVQVASDDSAGVMPTGTVTVSVESTYGGPTCDACSPVVAILGPDGRATARFGPAVTALMTPSAYQVRVQYSGDGRYAAGQLAGVDLSVVSPGPVLEPGLPVVVSLGDSYISGEAGRWAGNTWQSGSAYRADVNPATYLDAGGLAESIPGCHRSQNAEIHIDQAGAKVLSVNLACSGAETATAAEGGFFKPGIDFSQNEGLGEHGQALELYRLAAANPGRISMVVLSIGGNDFQFGSVVKTCLQQYLLGNNRRPCKSLPEVTSLFESANVNQQLANITGAIQHVDDAMTEAGYASSQWDLLVQDYPSPVPGEASRVRYREGVGGGRQFDGGCGMFDTDLEFANRVMLPTINGTVQLAVEASGLKNAHFLDLSNAYFGNRLCEKGVDLVGGGKPVKMWTDEGAMLGSEWVAQIRIASAIFDTPFQLQESLHPNYWGQLTNQACVKLAYNGGDVRGGSCVRVGGIYPNLDGDDRTYPVMELVDTAPGADARPR